jgi:hypothetical protein
MKELEVRLHSFLIFVLDAGGLSAASCGRLTSRKKAAVLFDKFNTLNNNNNNNNNNNVTVKQEGLHQMEDEMGVICST